MGRSVERCGRSHPFVRGRDGVVNRGGNKLWGRPFLAAQFPSEMRTPSLPAGLTPAIALAFAVVYLVWGSTYVANIIAIESIPPFVLIASRLLVAGTVLFGFAYARKNLVRRRRRGDGAGTWTWPTRRVWRNLALTAFLFLTVGLGAVVWAEQYIESGPTALLVALEPLAVVLVLWGFDRERPRWQAFVGIALGIAGTALLVGEDANFSGEGVAWGIAAIGVAIFAWAVGSVLTARLRLPEDRLSTAAYQMLLAGAFAVPLAGAMGDFAAFEWSAVTARSAWAWGFLVVFGSIIAYSAFLYLLKEVSPEKVATSTYVHPVVALTLGVLIRDEVVTLQTGLACVVLLTGVLFVNATGGGHGAKAETGHVLRRWRGRARPGQSERLAAFLESVVLPDMRAQAGNLDARLIRDPDDGSLLGVESHWADHDAIDRFAGKGWVPKRYDGQEGLVEDEGQEVRHLVI